MSLREAQSEPSPIDRQFDAGARSVLVRGRTGIGMSIGVGHFVRDRVSRGPVLVLAPRAFHEQFNREISDPEAGVDVGAWGSRAVVEIASPLNAQRGAGERSADHFATIVVAEGHIETRDTVRAVVDHFSGAQVLEISYMPKGHPGLLEVDAEIDLTEPEPSYAPRP